MGIRCPVCSTELDPGEGTRCPHCEAPHHPDCWAYLGGCATYGCTGNQIQRWSGSRPFPRLPGRAVFPEGTPFHPEYARGGTVLAWSDQGARLELSPAETAFEIPPQLRVRDLQSALRIRPALPVPVAINVTLVLIGGALIVLEPRLSPLFVLVLAWLLRHVREQARLARAVLDRRLREARVLWLLRRPGRAPQIAMAETGAHPAPTLRRRPVERWPVGVLLTREWLPIHPGILGSRLRLHYELRLVVDWGLMEAGHSLDMVPPLPLPRPGESRTEFLESLRSMRRLGRQAAETLDLPYHEAFVMDLPPEAAATLPSPRREPSPAEAP